MNHISANNYKIVYNRINLYFSILPSFDLDPTDLKKATISYIASEYQIPETVIRDDFCFLFSFGITHKDCHYPIIPQKYADADNGFSLLDESDITLLTSFIEDICKQIKIGAFDREPFLSTLVFPESSYELSLSGEELQVLKNVMNTQTIDSIHELKFCSPNIIPFEIKNSYNYYPTPQSLHEILECVNFAINHKKQIYLNYGSKYEPPCTPVKIIYDNVENKYSLLCIHRKTYKIYNIEKICPGNLRNDLTPYDPTQNTENQYIHVLKQDASSYDLNALMEKVPHVWKNNFDTKTSLHVKVRFSAKVYDSVLFDLAYRNPEQILSKPEGDYFYLEDDIYGKDAFDRWIRGYGKDALILEPESMVANRIKNLKKCLELYE